MICFTGLSRDTQDVNVASTHQLGRPALFSLLLPLSRQTLFSVSSLASRLGNEADFSLIAFLLERDCRDRRRKLLETQVDRACSFLSISSESQTTYLRASSTSDLTSQQPKIPYSHSKFSCLAKQFNADPGIRPSYAIWRRS